MLHKYEVEYFLTLNNYRKFRLESTNIQNALETASYGIEATEKPNLFTIISIKEIV